MQRYHYCNANGVITCAGGADDVDHDLTHPSNVEILSDGRIVSLSPVGNQLYVFAADGRALRALGKRGSGPGELMAPGGMSRARGDTLVITDGANNRINWLLAMKGFVGSKPYPTDFSGRHLRPRGALRSGELVMSTGGRLQRGVEDSFTRPPASVLVISANGERARNIASVPDFELAAIETRYGGRRNITYMPIRFTRFASVVAWDLAIATGSGEGYRIDLRNSAGVVRSSLRVLRSRRAVTKAMRDSVVAYSLRSLSSQVGERVDPAESRRVEEVRPSADSLPPYVNFFVTPNHTLWVVDPRAPGDLTGTATVFRQDGAIIGRLTWKVNGGPIAFGDDRIVVRQTNEDDVVSLVVYRIQKSGR